MALLRKSRRSSSCFFMVASPPPGFWTEPGGRAFGKHAAFGPARQDGIRVAGIFLSLRYFAFAHTPAASCSFFRRPHHCDQLVAVMLELLVADAGDAAELVQCRRPRTRDAVDRRVVQYDIGRHAALARDFGTPRSQRGDEDRVAGPGLAGGQGRKVAAPRFAAAGAVAGAGGLFAQP